MNKIEIKKAIRNKKTGCLLWTGAQSMDGYGVITDKNKRLLAHRVVYSLAVGPIDNQLQVLHKCDTPACIEPTHLFVGTQKENIADMVKKKRNVTPQAAERNGNAKLTAAQVRYIRTRGHKRGAKQILAKKFGISRTMVSAILLNRSWKYEHCYP